MASAPTALSEPCQLLAAAAVAAALAPAVDPSALQAIVARVDAALAAQAHATATLTATVARLEASVMSLGATVRVLDRRAAVAYKATAGEGVVRPFMLMPNARAQLPARPAAASRAGCSTSQGTTQGGLLFVC